MRRSVRIGLVSVIFTALAMVSMAAGAETLHETRADSYRTAMLNVAKSVVRIETVGGSSVAAAETIGSRRNLQFVVADGPTTGLVYSKDGLILTSLFNFVHDPSVITVTLADGQRLIADLVSRDEVRNLAMLRVDASDLPVAEWRDPADAELRVGETAIAVGRGLASRRTSDDLSGCLITVGIVSGVNRMSGLAIQTDARLSPMNFGGPLIDWDGRVMGIAVPMGLGRGALAGTEWYDSGIGFAVPLEQMQRSAEDLAAGRSIRLGQMGMRVDPRSSGHAVVMAVADPSPAKTAGIEAGDRITRIDDRPIRSFADLQQAMRPCAAGDEIELRIERGGEEEEETATELDLRIRLVTSDEIGEFPQMQLPFGLPMPDTRPATQPIETQPADIEETP
jgi:serine protease Do